MGKQSILLKSGEKFNKLTVIELDHITSKLRKNGQTSNIEYYKCQCECGNIVLVQKACLKNNHVQSCGCLNLANHTKHNGKGTRLYRIWVGIKTRCNNPNSDAYMNYGGRGIKICDEWMQDFTKFRNWANLAGYKNDLSIDRIDNNGNYEPTNCRWVKTKEQNNNRRTNHYITYNNKTYTIAEWAQLRNIRPDTLRNRIVKHNWSIEKALGYV